APAFYALGDSRTPMIISLLSMGTNFLMNWSLVGVMQERGLALSTSAVGLANFGLLYFIMRKRINGIEGRRTATTVAKILLASAVMGGACWATSLGLGRALGDSFLARLSNVSLSVAISAVSFYCTASILRVDELKAATSALAGRLLRR
ncbi:MAG TPA: lipid II flippase MurJ, partial [Blastocatellia bacterium]|nr:lipid II flippase MurJ [Blastocatellia bacterium]